MIMKKYIWIPALLIPFASIAQETHEDLKRPVKIFNTERTILANTTQPVGKGKMQFLVTHYFDDIGGSNGGLKNFFGLDNSTDIRIGFNFGLTDRLDAGISRYKSGHPRAPLVITKNYEIWLKYQLLRQIENDPSHPISASLYVANSITSMAKNTNYQFQDFGDRNSQVYQLILAKKAGKVSLQLIPTLVHQGYLISNDLQKTMFALGGTVRVPVLKDFNVIVDYFKPFRTQESEDAFASIQNFNPPIKFYAPLGIGFEIITAGHVFHLNFTNSTQIQEARFIPYTVKNWGDGQFRWGFSIVRTFVLWRVKNETVNW
jgi:hypothetical protein